MAKSVKKILLEEIDKLQKAVEKLLNTGKAKSGAQLILQPVRNKNI